MKKKELTKKELHAIKKMKGDLKNKQSPLLPTMSIRDLHPKDEPLDLQAVATMAFFMAQRSIHQKKKDEEKKVIKK